LTARDGKPIMAKPNLTMTGRTAGSPDNAQGTHFFLINDTGTYYLRKLPPAPHEPFDADTLVARRHGHPWRGAPGRRPKRRARTAGAASPAPGGS